MKPRFALMSRREHMTMSFVALAFALAIAGCGGGGSSGEPSGHAKTSTATATVPSTATTTPATPPAQHGTEIAPGTVKAMSGTLTAVMHASTHSPRANRAWPISFSVTRAGRPAKASVGYEYLFAGQVVAHRSHYTFHGRFSDIFRWPGSAVGYPLTFRAVIASGASTIELDYPVRVQR
jgi:hypothetical protein